MAYLKSKRELVATYKDTLSSYYLKKRYCCSTELGLCKRGRYRADFIALNMKRDIVIVECKSCLSDFRSDHKWKSYLKYCNKFYFYLSEDLYQKIKCELPADVGVFVNGYIVKNAKRREVSLDVQMDILTRMAFRSAEFNRLRRK